MTVRVDLAQLSEWAHQSLKAATPGQRRLAVANLLSASIRMSLALEGVEENAPLTMPVGLAKKPEGLTAGNVIRVVREHCCEDPTCPCHGKAATK